MCLLDQSAIFIFLLHTPTTSAKHDHVPAKICFVLVVYLHRFASMRIYNLHIHAVFTRF